MERPILTPAEIVREHPLFKKVFELGLPKNSSAVFAGAALVPHGLREQIDDVDMVAIGDAWDIAASIVTPKRAYLGGYKIEIAVQDDLGKHVGDIEIFDSWGPGEWDLNRLIKEAHEFEGLRFVRLEEVLRWKQLTNRDKDLKDIEAIQDFLATLRQ